MSVYNGFHGTSKKAAKEIENGMFKINRHEGKVPSDLGDGIYFFMDEPDRFEKTGKEMAKSFAKRYVTNGNGKEVRVLQGNIKTSSVLDLNSKKNSLRFDRLRNVVLSEVYKKFESKPWSVKKHGNIDGFVVNKLVTKILPEEPDIVISYTYTPLKKDLNNGRINSKEMAVRKPCIISLVSG